MQTITEQNKAIKYLLYFFKIILNYIKYNFLTGSVILSIGIAVFVVLNIDPNTSFEFMKNLSFIDSRYSAGDYSVNGSDLMKIFSIFSLFLYILISIITLILNKLFNIILIIKLRYKILACFLIILLAYMIAFIVMASNKSFNINYYFIIGALLIINLICAITYILFDFIVGKLNLYLNSFPKTIKSL